jgi:large subunit ribosomal protein L21
MVKLKEMFAIVDIAGQQMKVEKDQKLYVHRLEGEEGSQVEFGKVLLVDNDGKISVGQPLVEGVSIAAKILAHVKGDKVLIFKKKRRKGYQKLNGHRQQFSQILIEDIVMGGGKKKSAKAAKKVEEPEMNAPVAEENIPTTEN